MCHLGVRPLARKYGHQRECQHTRFGSIIGGFASLRDFSRRLRRELALFACGRVKVSRAPAGRPWPQGGAAFGSDNPNSGPESEGTISARSGTFRTARDDRAFSHPPPPEYLFGERRGSPHRAERLGVGRSITRVARARLRFRCGGGS
jgi:hypothetical protein